MVPASPGSTRVPRARSEGRPLRRRVAGQREDTGQRGKKKPKQQTADTRADQLSKRPRDWKPQSERREQTVNRAEPPGHQVGVKTQQELGPRRRAGRGPPEL